MNADDASDVCILETTCACPVCGASFRARLCPAHYPSSAPFLLLPPSAWLWIPEPMLYTSPVHDRRNS